jgi:plasmid stabilization system protein ParE
MIEIEWTSSAIRDVRVLRNYIAYDSEYYAERFTQKIVDAVGKLASFPLMERHMPEAGDDSIREILLQKYRIIYRIEPSQISVLMVVYGGRDLDLITPLPWESI